MSRMIVVTTITLALGVALAPTAGQTTPFTGNRKNGNDYQPTPREVLPLERRAGAAGAPDEIAAHRRTLRRIYRELLPGGKPRSRSRKPDTNRRSLAGRLQATSRPERYVRFVEAKA